METASYEEAFQYVCKVQEATNKEYQEHYKITWKAGDVPKFRITRGPRFYKVISVGHQEMVFCFIEKATGNLYKAASWSAPAKDARGNIRDENPPITLSQFYKHSTRTHAR